MWERAAFRRRIRDASKARARRSTALSSRPRSAEEIDGDKPVAAELGAAMEAGPASGAAEEAGVAVESDWSRTRFTFADSARGTRPVIVGDDERS